MFAGLGIVLSIAGVAEKTVFAMPKAEQKPAP
jgi:hypothetical protein